MLALWHRTNEWPQFFDIKFQSLVTQNLDFKQNLFAIIGKYSKTAKIYWLKTKTISSEVNGMKLISGIKIVIPQLNSDPLVFKLTSTSPFFEDQTPSADFISHMNFNTFPEILNDSSLVQDFTAQPISELGCSSALVGARGTTPNRHSVQQ
jgi:hypothetical protein